MVPPHRRRFANQKEYGCTDRPWKDYVSCQVINIQRCPPLSPNPTRTRTSFRTTKMSSYTVLFRFWCTALFLQTLGTGTTKLWLASFHLVCCRSFFGRLVDIVLLLSLQDRCVLSCGCKHSFHMSWSPSSIIDNLNWVSSSHVAILTTDIFSYVPFPKGLTLHLLVTFKHGISFVEVAGLNSKLPYSFIEALLPITLYLASYSLYLFQFGTVSNVPPFNRTRFSFSLFLASQDTQRIHTSRMV